MRTVRPEIEVGLMFEIIVILFLFVGVLFAETTVGVLKWGILLLAVIKLSEK